jgi:predicted aminopeptidase
LLLLRWIRTITSSLLLVLLCTAAVNHRDVIYIAGQAQGQLHILLNAKPIEESRSVQKPAAALVADIRRYSVDSFGYKATRNYTRLYEHPPGPLLWVLTASHADSIFPYKWYFPVTGAVSYKGFFDRKKAIAEYNHLVCEGYDVEMRPVTAWSTLGWFPDPVMSGMLSRSRSELCELLFHELFHSTYYESGQDEKNENLACFFAEKATEQFLRNDTVELKKYRAACSDERLYNAFMIRQIKVLSDYYAKIRSNPAKKLLKLRALQQVADSMDKLPLANKKRFMNRKKHLLTGKNASLVGFRQYSNLQDSLEKVFNKFYRRDLKKMVQHLKSV